MSCRRSACCPARTTSAFDVSSTIPEDSWYGSVLRGILGFRPAMTVLEVVVWAAYVGITTLDCSCAPPATVRGCPRLRRRPQVRA